MRSDRLWGYLEDMTEAYHPPWMRRIRLSRERRLAQVCVMHRGYMRGGGCWARIYAIDANVYNDILLSVLTQIHILFFHFITRTYAVRHAFVFDIYFICVLNTTNTMYTLLFIRNQLITRRKLSTRSLIFNQADSRTICGPDKFWAANSFFCFKL